MGRNDLFPGNEYVIEPLMKENPHERQLFFYNPFCETFPWIFRYKRTLNKDHPLLRLLCLIFRVVWEECHCTSSVNLITINLKMFGGKLQKHTENQSGLKLLSDTRREKKRGGGGEFLCCLKQRYTCRVFVLTSTLRILFLVDDLALFWNSCWVYCIFASSVIQFNR